MKAASLLLGLLSLVQLAAAGGVLAIDYGTEWMKVSLVKPGVPFDVLLNTLVLYYEYHAFIASIVLLTANRRNIEIQNERSKASSR